MSDKLRILITGFGPFPGAPFNPTQPLVARLLRLRRPAFSDVELIRPHLSGHLQRGRSPIAGAAGQHRPHALLMFGLAAPHAASADRDPRPQCRHDAVARRRPDAGAQGIDRGGADAMMFGPHTAKTAARRRRHRHRCARLARRRQLSLQLSELARDRGDGADDDPAPRRLRAYSAAGARRCPATQGHSARITLEELVDAGEAMLLEMVRLTRQAAREARPAVACSRGCRVSGEPPAKTCAANTHGLHDTTASH